MGILRRLWTALSDAPFQLPSAEYHHLRNVVVPTDRGTTEVDHLIVSRFGVFVVELKDRTGWIFGDPFDPFWTSVNFGQRYRFQNPLHQNYGHIKALEALLGIQPRVLKGVVVFRGPFRFKTPVPDGVLLHRYRAWVASHREIVLTDGQVDVILQTLREQTRQGWSAGRQHARSVRERFASDSDCPKCGGALVVRTQRQGGRPGSQFLGCSNFPRCRFTKSLR